MMNLMQSQPITKATCESILDDFTFDIPPVVEVPSVLKEKTKYFKAPWDI